MRFDVHINQLAEQDLLNASDYIEYTLMNPDAADALLDAFEEEANDIGLYPKKYPLVQDSILASWGIRFTLVKNYILFYTVDEETSTVHIVRFLNARSNWMVTLRSGYTV